MNDEKKNKEQWIETIRNIVHINPTVSKVRLKVNKYRDCQCILKKDEIPW